MLIINQDNNGYVLENDFLRIHINPNKGGVVDKYLVKDTDRQLLGDGLFMLGDHFWQESWPGQLLNVSYETKIVEQTPEFSTIEVSRIAGEYFGSTLQKDIKVTRRMTLRADSSQLFVEVSLENVGNIGRIAGYWNQSILYASGNKEKVQLYYRPTTRGVSVATYDKIINKCTYTAKSDNFVKNPQQGWTALLGDNGTTSGIAFVMKYDELMYFLNLLEDFTCEWQYNAVNIPPGKTWKTDFVVYPIADLPTVDYASRTMVASVEPFYDDGVTTIRLFLASAATKLEDVIISGYAMLAKTPDVPGILFEIQQVNSIDIKPVFLTFKIPHDYNDPLILRFTVKAKSCTGKIEEQFETWYDAKLGENWKLDGSAIYTFPTPERKVTFIKPDVIKKIHNDIPQVLFCKGVFASEYLPQTIFEKIKAEITSSYFSVTKDNQWPPSLSVFPASYKELMMFDIISLINIDAVALGNHGQEMLKDFVHHGGTLVYGGDFWAYSNANLGNDQLSDLLPVTFPTKGSFQDRLQFLEGCWPVNISSNNSLLSKDAVMVYASDNFTVKDNAEVLLSSGDKPVLVKWNVGKGQVIAITGTALGDAPPGKILFTRTPEWATFLYYLIFFYDKNTLIK